jgi:hypothetical protein
LVTIPDAEAIAEAVQRPTMKFVATKTAEQLDLQGPASRARAVGQPARNSWGSATGSGHDATSIKRWMRSQSELGSGG